MSVKEPEFMNRSKFTKLIETQVLEKKLGYILIILTTLTHKENRWNNGNWIRPENGSCQWIHVTS